MSGIFGVFNLDGGPSPETDRTVWADARLDYRDELCQSLGLSPNDTPNDAGLILAAYLKWGEACVDHLLGDFAFAILDPREKRLFCARDHFGMRPFYYHHAPGKHFVFASDARAIFQVPEVPYAINEGRVADFLVPELEWIDYTSTFYDDVYRLPPGNTVAVTIKKLEIREYWEPAPGPEPGPMTDADWQHGFLEVFTRAVEERLRGSAAGVMLSGGMDSGSVAAVANGLLSGRDAGPLRTVSAARPDNNCVESNRIRATAGFLGATTTMVGPDDLGDLDETLTSSIEEPFDAEYLFMKAIFLKAREQGLNALLDGGAGDIIFNDGSYIPRLIRRGKLTTAFREIKAAQSFWKSAPLAVEYLRYLGKGLTPRIVKKAVRPLSQAVSTKRFVEASMIDGDFAHRVDIEERCARMFSLFPTGHANFSQERVQKIRPNVSAGRERYARLGAFSGVEVRDPFLDLRVIQFCSRLPGHLLLRDGWPKFILRKVMADKLPDEVRWGTGKPHIGWSFNESFIKRSISRGSLSLDALRGSLDGYIDTAKLDNAWHTFIAGGNSGPVHSAYVLSQWLEQTVTRPVVNNQGFR